MNRTFNFLLACLFCFSLTLLTGCGDGGGGRHADIIPSSTPAGQSTEVISSSTPAEVVPSLTPAEQADVDRYIREHGRDAIVFYLFDTRTRPSTDKKLVLKYLEYFISQGADVNAERVGRQTPLYHASAAGDIDVVKFLVSKGADVNAAATGSLRPLYIASIGGNIEVVKFLVSEGADVNAKDSEGRTPLEVAKRTLSDIERGALGNETERVRMLRNNLSAVINYLSGL